MILAASSSSNRKATMRTIVLDMAKIVTQPLKTTVMRPEHFGSKPLIVDIGDKNHCMLLYVSVVSMKSQPPNSMPAMRKLRPSSS